MRAFRACRVVAIALRDVLIHASHAEQVVHPDLRGLRRDACAVLVRYLDSQAASDWGAGKACMPLMSLLHLETVRDIQLPKDLDLARAFGAAGLMMVRTAVWYHSGAGLVAT